MECLALEQGERLLTIWCRRHAEPLALEDLAHEIEDAWLIVDEKYSFHRGLSQAD
jgi:hypothetical protein